MDSVEIRAHHIESAKFLYNLSLKGIANLLVQDEYIKKDAHPFITLVYQFARLFDKPSQKFKLKIGQLDFICESCPKLEKRVCDLKKQELGGVQGRDMEIIDEYDLDINKTYTSAELREKFGF